jgi:hypothetical protein
MDPVADPPLLRKSGRAGNRTQTSGSVARKSDLYTTEAVINNDDIIIIIIINGSIDLLLYLGSFLMLLILYTVNRTPWTEDQPFIKPLPTHRTTQIWNKHTQISVLREGIEPTTPKIEQDKTFHASDSTATVISKIIFDFLILHPVAHYTTILNEGTTFRNKLWVFSLL